MRTKGGLADVSPELFAIASEDISDNAEELRQRLAKDASLVGLRAAFTRHVAGTDAAVFATAINGLRSHIAQQKARELALINEGDTLLGTTMEWQCKTLADSVASLDLGQSSGQLMINLDLIGSHFRRMSKILQRESAQ